MAEGDEYRGTGDTQADAIEATFRNEAAGLARYFQRGLRGSGDPFEFVQEVFARLINRSHKGAIHNPAALMTRIARNLLIDHGRRQQFRTHHGEPFDVDVDIPVPPTQHIEVETSQMMERFRAAIERLPPRTKEVFLLHHTEELLYREIATRLEISVRTVEWHMGEAMLRIRRMLDE